jgi:NAD(P)H-dependent FMN reductase
MSRSGSMRFLGVAGSMRHGSLNRAMLRAAQAMVPDGRQIDSFNIAPILLYNEGGKFDAVGNLTDHATRNVIAPHLAAFKASALRLRRVPAACAA